MNKTCKIGVLTNLNSQAGQFEQHMAVLKETRQDFDEDGRDGMYEDLQNRLGKSYIEVRKIIATL